MRARLLTSTSLCAVTLLIAGAATATAAMNGKTARAPRLSLVSPSNGARINVGTRAFVVRVRASGPGFLVTINGHDVTARFGRPRNGVRSARLVRGRDFQLGRNSFVAAIGKRYSHGRRAVAFRFVARRRVDSMMAIRRLTRTSSSNGGLGSLNLLGDVIGRAGAVVSLQSPKRPSALRLTVNGRGATGDLTRLGGGRRAVGVLGASSGLHFGVNRLAAYMNGPKWTYARRSIRVRVSRTAPLAGAGANRRAGVGNPLLLNGSKSRAGRTGQRLLYRWTVASAPKGAKVRLRNARSAKALLRASTPGRYQLKLTVASVPRHKSAQRNSAASTATSFATAARRGDVAVDSTTVSVSPTMSPMGVPIETMATFPGQSATSISMNNAIVLTPSGGDWAQMIVLDQQTLQVVQNQVFDASDPSALADAVANTSDQQIVIISGRGVAQSSVSNGMSTALSQAVQSLGGTMPSSGTVNGALSTGNWSVLGTNGIPGRIVENLDSISEAPVPGQPSNTAPGSLNGYLQNVTSAAGYSFVSPEFVPVNTQASGSSDTESVFTIGPRSYTGSIPSGALGIHLVAVSSNASLTPVFNQTFVINNPGGGTDQGADASGGTGGSGVMGLAYTLQSLRRSPQNLLLVMQTVGTGDVPAWTAPGASPNWVNDDLIQPGSNGLWQWNQQSYSSDSLTALDSLWNPGYPTVAGEVGQLTGAVGHDLVANFGGTPIGGQGGSGYEVTRLSMVANNRPYDPSMNYINGYTAPAPDQLTATLTRTSESQWQVNGGVPTDAFGGPGLWQLAFKTPTPWPYTSPGKAPDGSIVSGTQASQYQAAMRYIAGQLWPGEGITDVRSQYVSAVRIGGGWATFAESNLAPVTYPTTSDPGFSVAQFKTLKRQLTIEMDDVDQVQGAIGNWQEIFNSTSSHALVNLTGLTGTITSQIIAGDAQRGGEETSINPLDVASDALLVGGSLLGFPELAAGGELVEQIGVAAHVFDFAGATLGLASSASGSGGSGGSTGPNTALITDRASQLGADLVTRFDIASKSLAHLGDIYDSDWGKLKQAASNAVGNWAMSTDSVRTIQQSLSITAKQGFYEALMPLAYRQWVISPYVTVSNGTGPDRPGTDYQCIHYRPAYESNQIQKPFQDEPSGAMSWVNYRPWESPGDTTSPAQPFTTNYTVRALKAWYAPLTLQTVDLGNGQQGLTIDDWGDNPPAGWIDDLFKPVNSGEPDPQTPNDLGMSKTEFYADYGGGGQAWGRMICAEGSG